MPIIDAWHAVCGQWRAIERSDGRLFWQGLDYAGVRAGLAGAAIELTAAQWTLLRLMESTAASTLNGQRG